MSSQNISEIAIQSVHAPVLETYLSAADVCQKLKISQKTLQRWEQDGFLVPSVRLRGRRLYEEWVIAALLHSQVVFYGTGITSEKQFNVLSAYLEQKHICGEIRVDQKSPYDLSRPFFLQTMKDIFERKVSHIIVTHEDRFLPVEFLYQDFFKAVHCSFTCLNKGQIEEEKSFDEDFCKKKFK